MHRSERVAFEGGAGYTLAGILDQPSGHSSAAILFTHCFTCNKDLKAIVRISRGLAALGFTVLRYDLTGLGGSGGDFSQTNFSTNCADLQAAANFLEQRIAAPAFLIGHSFGGVCSLAMAGTLSCVRGVITLAAPSDTPHLADLLQRMNPRIVSEGQGEVTIGGRTYTITDRMLSDFRQHDVPAQLSRLAKPVLLFHSPEDETVHFGHALRLYSLLTQRADDIAPAAPVSLMCLPQADHLLVNNPADITLFTQVTAAWCQRIEVIHKTDYKNWPV